MTPARALLALLGLAICQSCSVPEVTCEFLAAKAVQCDLQPQRMQCHQMSAEARALLAERFVDQGCDGLWDPDTGTIVPDACRAFGWQCPAPLGPTPEALATRYPVLFVGGIDGRPAFDWDERIVNYVRDHTGSEVARVLLSPWATTEVRARDLWHAVQRHTASGTPRLNLVCYAVSGIDCRYLVSAGGLFADDPATQRRAAEAVASITTIATPHRGTQVAQAALTATDTGAGSLWATVIGSPGEGYGGISNGLRQTLGGLTNEHLHELNQRLPDSEQVYYQSFAGVSHVAGLPLLPVELEIRRYCAGPDGSPRFYRYDDTRDAMSELLLVSAPYAARSLDTAGQPLVSPHDGMVSVHSARWGEFRGCIPADHYDVIGQLEDGGADPRTGFDAPRFYGNVVAELARMGF